MDGYKAQPANALVVRKRLPGVTGMKDVPESWITTVIWDP